jgi:hypothetical protein
LAVVGFFGGRYTLTASSSPLQLVCILRSERPHTPPSVQAPFPLQTQVPQDPQAALPVPQSEFVCSAYGTQRSPWQQPSGHEPLAHRQPIPGMHVWPGWHAWHSPPAPPQKVFENPASLDGMTHTPLLQHPLKHGVPPQVQKPP